MSRRFLITSLERRLFLSGGAPAELLATLPASGDIVNAEIESQIYAGGRFFFTSGRQDRGEELYVAPDASSASTESQLLLTSTTSFWPETSGRPTGISQ